MAPTVKDVENSTTTSTPAPPSTTVATKPQPVPLEVPVSVNGARTIEGSDKREPFSESTKTVLVFANGAVIRLASNVAPGQLLFVTNEKTKKEVVCQVVKSKNYRTVTGYVELEFTEPAAGFWGVRIPAEPLPSSGVPKAAVAPPRPIAPVATGTPANVTQKVAVPVAPAQAAPVAPPAAPVAATPAVPPVEGRPNVAPPATPPVAAVTPKPETGKPEVPVVPPQAKAVDPNSLSAQLAAQFSALVSNEVPVASSQPAASEVAKTAAPAKSGDVTTEELRQQAARLQEQLSSLLFREAATQKAPAPVAPPAPIASAPIAPAQPPVVAPPPVQPPVIKEAVKELLPEAETPKPQINAAPIKVAPAPLPVPEIKAPAIASKSPSLSLPVEEVKIPAWLAPLARETESSKEASSASQAASTAISEESPQTSSEEQSYGIESGSSEKSQSVVFGGQLLGGSESSDAQASGSGSKKGLVIGLIAATVLGAAGAVWYGLQPGNFLASKSVPVAAAQRNSTTSNETAAVKTDAAATSPASTTNPATSAPSSNAGASKPATNPTASTQLAESLRNSNFTSTPVATPPSANAARSATAAPVETPKKPSLGDVRLATPTVNRNANSASPDAAPSLDVATEVPAATDPLAGISGAHSKEPSAPLPIGGDVKPAKLLKSVPPVYPPAARSQRIGGNVQLDALIDASGNVTTTKIISGPTLLHQAAMTAVKQWKYEPAQLDGKPTAMHLTVTVQFRLQ